MRRTLSVAFAALLASAGLLAAPRPAAASWSGSITILPGGDGVGRITSDDGGIDCSYADSRNSGDCSQSYTFPDFLQSSLVTITYTPGAHSYVCVDSAGGCLTNGAPHSVTMEFRPEYTNHITILPQFRLRSYRVEVSIEGPGSISSGGETCAPKANYEYCRLFKYGTQATFTAVPDAGKVFTYWGGNPCAGFDPTCTFTVTANMEYLSVVFGKVQISLDTEGSGTACATSGASLCTEGLIPPVSNFITVGTTMVIGTEPASGWRFDHWNSGGPCAGQGATCTFTVTTAKSLVATFTRVSTATPRPTPTPTPKPTPKASATARPAPTPTASVAALPPTATPARSGSPAATAVPAEPTALPTGEPGASPLGTTGPPASDGPSVSGAPSSDTPGGSTAPARSAAPVGSGAAGDGGQSGLLLGLLALLVAMLVVGLGFALGRRRRAPARPEVPA